MIRLAPGLPSTIPTAAGFVFWDPNQFSIPVHPLRREVSDLPSSKAEPAGQQANQPRLEPTGFKK